MLHINVFSGTNIGRALDVAVQLINKGVDWKVPVNTTAVGTAVGSEKPSEPEADATVSPATTAAATEVAVKDAEDAKRKCFTDVHKGTILSPCHAH